MVLLAPVFVVRASANIDVFFEKLFPLKPQTDSPSELQGGYYTAYRVPPCRQSTITSVVYRVAPCKQFANMDRILQTVTMPGRNIEKDYIEDSFYHAYNRGLNKMTIFKDDNDYRVFLNLLKRALGDEVQTDKQYRDYPNFHNDLELLSYCLMPNHFHLLIRTKNKPKLLPELMRSIMTAYVMYFNKKNNRTGRLFEQRYRAVRITSDDYLWHISRYIHLNPLDVGQDYKDYPYSSVGYYTQKKSSDWVKPDEIKDMFQEAKQDYGDFLADFVDRKEELNEIKAELF